MPPRRCCVWPGGWRCPPNGKLWPVRPSWSIALGNGMAVGDDATAVTRRRMVWMVVGAVSLVAVGGGITVWAGGGRRTRASFALSLVVGPGGTVRGAVVEAPP